MTRYLTKKFTIYEILIAYTIVTLIIEIVL